MRDQPSPENHAAVRVHERLEDKVRANPNPPRSEIIDLMVQEALDREQVIDEAKAEKMQKGLKAAQRRPVVAAPAAQPTQPQQTAQDNMPELEFFENLLAPAPASTDHNKENGNDN